jgi:integrase
VQKAFIVLRMCLDDAAPPHNDLLAKNPAKLVKQPAIPHSEARHLSDAETDQLLAQVQGTRAEAIINFLANTGLRKGEALALKWADIDLEKGTVRVAGTLTRLGGQLIISEPKTANSRRTIPLIPVMASLLKAQRKAQLEDKLRAGSVWIDSGHVFTTETGAPMDPRNVLRAVEVASRRAGLEDVNVHTLRHTAATRMLAAGIPLHVVSRILGHANVRITGDTYGHRTDEGDLAAMNAAALSSGLSSNG